MTTDIQVLVMLFKRSDFNLLLRPRRKCPVQKKNFSGKFDRFGRLFA